MKNFLFSRTSERGQAPYDNCDSGNPIPRKKSGGATSLRRIFRVAADFLSCRRYCNRSCSTGQAIVESIVAITVLIMVFVGVWGLLSSSFRFNRYVAEDYAATYLAAEGIEVVKNLLDANVINRRLWGCGFADGAYELEYNTFYDPDPPADCSNPYAALQPNQNRKLFLDTSSGLYTYNAAGLPTDFTRLIKIAVDTAGNPQEIHVNSVVSWRQGFSQKNVNLEDRFFNWYP